MNHYRYYEKDRPERSTFQENKIKSIPQGDQDRGDELPLAQGSPTSESGWLCRDAGRHKRGFFAPANTWICMGEAKDFDLNV